VRIEAVDDFIDDLESAYKRTNDPLDLAIWQGVVYARRRLDSYRQECEARVKKPEEWASTDQAIEDTLDDVCEHIIRRYADAPTETPGKRGARLAKDGLHEIRRHYQAMKRRRADFEVTGDDWVRLAELKGWSFVTPPAADPDGVRDDYQLKSRAYFDLWKPTPEVTAALARGDKIVREYYRKRRDAAKGSRP
jgi:hypothetical protein